MGNPHGRYHAQHFEPRGWVADVLEQTLAASEQDRHEAELHLVDEAGGQVLTAARVSSRIGVQGAAEPHVFSAAALALAPSAINQQAVARRR